MVDKHELPPSYVDNTADTAEGDTDDEIPDGDGPTMQEVFEDIEARFLINLPQEELLIPERLFFQIEQAWWFYEDHMADRYRHIPHYKKLEEFSSRLFQESSILRPYQHKMNEWAKAFKDYRATIPVYGVILLSPRMDYVLMITGYLSKTWGFPKGKVNENETGIACAMREGFEEVGYQISPEDIREEDSIEHTSMAGKYTKLYIVRNVPLDYKFKPHVRKEIGVIQWRLVSKLPTVRERKYWGVLPFTEKLKTWIKKKRRAERNNRNGSSFTSPAVSKADSWNNGYPFLPGTAQRNQSPFPSHFASQVQKPELKILHAPTIMAAVDKFLVL